MGQQEVFDWLLDKRKSGIDDYFSATQIEKGLQAKGYSNGTIKCVRKNLLVLEAFNVLEAKQEVNGIFRPWKRLFRFKNKLVK